MDTPFLRSADKKSFVITNPERNFDRPVGWIVAGVVGARREFIGDTHYQPALKSVTLSTGEDLSKRSQAVREVLVPITLAAGRSRLLSAVFKVAVAPSITSAMRAAWSSADLRSGLACSVSSRVV